MPARPSGDTPPGDTWQDWVEKFGVDPDRVRGMESEDLAWLRAGGAKATSTVPERGRSASTGTRAARTTISSFAAVDNAIITGDSLSNFGDGLIIQLGGRST